MAPASALPSDGFCNDTELTAQPGASATDTELTAHAGASANDTKLTAHAGASDNDTELSAHASAFATDEHQFAAFGRAYHAEEHDQCLSAIAATMKAKSQAERFGLALAGMAFLDVAPRRPEARAATRAARSDFRQEACLE